MSLFKSDDERRDARIEAMYDNPPDTGRECVTCGNNMTREKLGDDGLCADCRKHIAICREEEATAAFIDAISNPRPQPLLEAWFMKIITESGMTFKERIPESIDETCYALVYELGQFCLTLYAWKQNGDYNVLLERACEHNTMPDWCIPFDINVPESVILAAIKAAIATK